MLLPNDILIRTTSEGATLWVSQRLVVECCGVDEEYLRKKARFTYKQSLPASWRKVAEGGDFMLGDTGKTWRWGRKGGQYYYDYDRIPDRAPARYRSMLPGREELEAFVEDNDLTQSRERRAALRNALSAAAEEMADNADARWIQMHSGFQIDIAKCRDYSRALGWCRFITRVARDGQFEQYGTPTAGAFYDACASVLAEQRISNFSVSTAASLRKKLAGFPADTEEQRRWIISAKIGNNNSRKIGKYPLVNTETGEIYQFDVHEAVMYSLYMNVGRPQKDYLRTLYEEGYVPAMNEFGILPVSQSAFNNHLTKLSSRLKADLARHGEEYYRKHLQTYVPSEKLSYAHSLFCADGSGLLAYRYTRSFYDSKSKIRREETRIMHLYAILITDVASGYIAGYGIAPEGDHKETLDMVQEAVRMAVRNGGNRTMFEFVSDNHGAFSSAASREFLGRVFNRVRRIEKGNSQANPAEMLFRLFKNSALRSCFNFIRSSHGATAIENRANTDGISKFEYPTYEETILQLEEAIERWNHTPRGNGKTPAEMFEVKNPACEQLTESELRAINGTVSRLSIERMRGFVTPQRGNDLLRFEIPDFAGAGADAISRATGNHYDSEVVCYYDETAADLYSNDGRFILSCPRAGAAKTAYIETTQAHEEAREHLRRRKLEQLETAAQFTEEVESAAAFLAASGYNEAVQFGATKETTNAAYESFINLSVSDKKAADRARRNAERKEAREAARAAEEETERTLAGSRERRLKKFQKYNNQFT